MKTENKSQRVMSLITLCALFALPLAATETRAESNCQSFDEQLSAVSITPFGAANGVAHISLGGGAQVPVQATSVLLGTAENFDPLNPAPIQFRRAGQLFFPPGPGLNANVLTVVLDTTGVPTGFNTFDLTGKARFTGGVGSFEFAHGKADFVGTAVIDLNTGQVQTDATLLGKICGVDG